jgi:nucleotide-binding universal stress UspA family protein
MRAAAHAAQLTAKFGADTTIVTVVYVPPMYSSDVTGVEEALLEDGTRVLEHTKRIFLQEDVPCTTKLIRWVHPVEAICNEGVEGKYDLIVLGRTGLNEKKSLLGSVSEGVFRSAPCATLVVR